jgi:hypothetical protein
MTLLRAQDDSFAVSLRFTVMIALRASYEFAGGERFSLNAGEAPRYMQKT